VPDWIHLLPDVANIALLVALVVDTACVSLLVGDHVLRHRTPPEKGGMT